MKKIKFLPSVLMLVMCMAALCVGVFAASTTSNTVKGSITVTSMARIKITGYVNDEELFTTRNTASGVEWDLTKSDALKFDVLNASDKSEVPQKIIRIHIQNLSNAPLGAYFFNGNESSFETVDEVGYATYSSLEHSKEIYPTGLADADKNADTKLADVALSTYSYIAANDKSTGGYDEIDMFIVIDLANLFYEEYEGEFNFKLNVEEYNSNLTGKADGATKSLRRIAEATVKETKEIQVWDDDIFDYVTQEIDVYPLQTITDASAGVMAIPSSYTEIPAGAIKNCYELEHLVIPTSVTEMEATCLDGCASLVSLSSPISGNNAGGELYEREFCYSINSVYAFFGLTAFPSKYAENQKTVQYSDTYETMYEIIYAPNTFKTFYFTGSNLQTGMMWGGNFIFGSQDCIIDYHFGGDNDPQPVTGLTGITVSKLFIPKNVSYGSFGGYYYDRGNYLSCGVNLIQYGEGVTSVTFDQFTRATKAVYIPDTVTNISLGASAVIGYSSPTIFCEAQSAPAGWQEGWDTNASGTKHTVYWGVDM